MKILIDFSNFFNSSMAGLYNKVSEPYKEIIEIDEYKNFVDNKLSRYYGDPVGRMILNR